MPSHEDLSAASPRRATRRGIGHMRHFIRSITRTVLRGLPILFWFALVAVGLKASASRAELTSIFAPETTPARSIVNLSMFVLSITGGIFVIVVSDRKSTRLNSSHLGISYAVF